MANEVTNALLVTNGGKLAEILSDDLFQVAYDPTDLRSVVPYYAWKQGGGSATMSVPKIPAPGAAVAASSEISGGFSNSAFTTGEIQFTVARYGRQVQVTDLLGITGGSPVDYDLILGQLALAESLTFTDLICALFASVTANVGTTTVDMTVDDFYSAIYLLEIANVNGQLSAVLAPIQYTNFQESMRSEGGAVQYRPDTQGVLNAAQTGFKGSFAGVNIWTSDSVGTANAAADRQGAMFGPGAFGWTAAGIDAVDPMLSADDVLLKGDTWFVERIRDGANGMTTALLNMYPAVAIGENAQAVKITTDA